MTGSLVFSLIILMIKSIGLWVELPGLKSQLCTSVLVKTLNIEMTKRKGIKTMYLTIHLFQSVFIEKDLFQDKPAT